MDWKQDWVPYEQKFTDKNVSYAWINAFQEKSWAEYLIIERN